MCREEQPNRQVLHLYIFKGKEVRMTNAEIVEQCEIIFGQIRKELLQAGHDADLSPDTLGPAIRLYYRDGTCWSISPREMQASPGQLRFVRIVSDASQPDTGEGPILGPVLLVPLCLGFFPMIYRFIDNLLGARCYREAILLAKLLGGNGIVLARFPLVPLQNLPHELSQYYPGKQEGHASPPRSWPWPRVMQGIGSEEAGLHLDPCRLVRQVKQFAR